MNRKGTRLWRLWPSVYLYTDQNPTSEIFRAKLALKNMKFKNWKKNLFLRIHSMSMTCSISLRKIFLTTHLLRQSHFCLVQKHECFCFRNPPTSRRVLMNPLEHTRHETKYLVTSKTNFPATHLHFGHNYNVDLWIFEMPNILKCKTVRQVWINSIGEIFEFAGYFRKKKKPFCSLKSVLNLKWS